MALERLDHCQNSAHDTNEASKFLCLSLIASANYVHSLKHGLMYIRHFFLSFSIAWDIIALNIKKINGCF
jgi:hypothetical protein